MRIFKLILFSVFIIIFNSSTAQVIDNTASFRETGSNNYIRYYYDNDFFTATDYYYTQGMCLEFVNSGLKHFPLSRLLVTPKSFHHRFGVAIEHVGFTPTSIRHPEIINGDRPFAASLYLKTFAIAVSNETQQRLTSAFSIGVIGPATGGENMQVTIHRVLNNIEPLGWSNQIANDLVINYEFGYEKELFRNKALKLNWTSGFKLGTFNDKISSGLTIIAGLLPDFYLNDENEKKKFKIHLYNQAQISMVGYDASLQGGMFNHKSPYTISHSDIARFTFQDNAGIVIKLYGIHLEYFQSFITKEFEKGKYHRWGGIRIGYVF